MKWIYSFWMMALLPFSCGAEEAVIPKGYGVDRYEPIWKKSPFTLSSVKEAEVSAGFAEKFALSSILKVGDRDYVSVLNKESKERFLLSAKPGVDGIQVDKVESSQELDKVVVTLRKGNEVSVLRYDQEFIKQTMAQMPAPPPAPVNMNGANPVNQPPPAVKRPARRIIIPTQTAPPPK